MNKINRTQVAVFGLIAVLVLGFGLIALIAAFGGGWGMGPGMMGRYLGYSGPGRLFGGLAGLLFMGLMMLVPVGLLILLALGIVWLIKAVAPSGGQTSAVPSKTCPNCGRSVQADWQLCPHCGQKLTP